MKNKNIVLRALLTGMLCITSLTIFTGCIDKQDGDGMVNGRTADGELPENGDAEPVPIKAKYFVIGYALIELYAGFANSAGDNVAHFAHLGGMVFGFILIMYWRKKNRGNGYYYN